MPACQPATAARPRRSAAITGPNEPPVRSPTGARRGLRLPRQVVVLEDHRHRDRPRRGRPYPEVRQRPLVEMPSPISADPGSPRQRAWSVPRTSAYSAGPSNAVTCGGPSSRSARFRGGGHSVAVSPRAARRAGAALAAAPGAGVSSTDRERAADAARRVRPSPCPPAPHARRPHLTSPVRGSGNVGRTPLAGKAAPPRPPTYQARGRAEGRRGRPCPGLCARPRPPSIRPRRAGCARRWPRSASPARWRTSSTPPRRPGSTASRSSSRTWWCRRSRPPRSGPAAPTWASRSTSTSPSATSTPPTPSGYAHNLRRAERKFELMAELGTDLILVCSAVAPDAVADLDRLAAQLHGVAERAEAHGMRIAYEALAWGTQISTYEQSWEAVRRADHPALGLCLDSFHILSRGSRSRGHRGHPRREAVLPPARRRPAHGHGRAAVEPPLPPLPRPGRVRPARLPRPRADRGLHRAAVARGVQRRLPPVRPPPRRGGRPPFAAGAARGDRAACGRRRRAPAAHPGAARVRVHRDRRRRHLRGRPSPRCSPRSASSTPGRHRSKPVQLWEQGEARVVLNESGRDGASVVALGIETADPPRRAGRATALLAPPLPQHHGPAEADLLGVTAPDGTAVFFCHTATEGVSWLADFLPTGTPSPAGARSPTSTTSRSPSPTTTSTRPRSSTARCSACSPSTRPRSPPRSAWCATGRSATAA